VRDHGNGRGTTRTICSVFKKSSTSPTSYRCISFVF
jgi:hypothetical protein